jgi:hypothetical protein
MLGRRCGNLSAVSGDSRSRLGPIVLATVTIAVVVTVAVAYRTRGHADLYSHRAVKPQIPVASAGSATFTAVRQVTDPSCVAANTVKDIKTNRCYEVVGQPIARANDVTMAFVRNSADCWCIDMTLNGEAAARLDRFNQTAPDSQTVAIRIGSKVLAFPRSRQPLPG